MAQDFKNLNVWKESHDLTIQIYNISRIFPKEESYGLTQQLRRACISIELNIAEGTSGTQNQFLKHLIIALGSAKETECCIILSKDLEYILKVQNNRTLFCTFVYTKVINLYEN
ncbi:four helix bundle protein [Candidatus Woesearchaeota archaeon]|nr:four helix bundle protein [Candidatus Woesearchaeota archaeon]